MFKNMFGLGIRVIPHWQDLTWLSEGMTCWQVTRLTGDLPHLSPVVSVTEGQWLVNLYCCTADPRGSAARRLRPFFLAGTDHVKWPKSLSENRIGKSECSQGVSFHCSLGVGLYFCVQRVPQKNAYMPFGLTKWTFDSPPYPFKLLIEEGNRIYQLEKGW